MHDLSRREGRAVAARPHCRGRATLGPNCPWTGNHLPHVILRGSDTGPNWQSASRLAERMKAAGLMPSIILDASHGNSGGDPRMQGLVALSALDFRKRGVPVRGIMLESYLEEGRQDLIAGQVQSPRLSITDACLGMKETASILGNLTGK
ncbi:MAG: hypothetical protein E4H20_00730 [Spirochaetales bacterium]|nr:MAG: hypothetical protein E4H20_00730 [Spirochaetales bacterium]